jgi:hypothetical protein
VIIEDDGENTVILAADGLVPESQVLVRNPADASVIAQATVGADGTVRVELTRSSVESLAHVVINAEDAIVGPVEYTVSLFPPELAFETPDDAGDGGSIRSALPLLLVGFAALLCAIWYLGFGRGPSTDRSRQK